MSKGVKLPDREGLWDEVPSSNFPDVVMYRRLPDKKPLPQLKAGTLITAVGGYQAVVSRKLGDTYYAWYTDSSECFAEGLLLERDVAAIVDYDGCTIWKREEA